MVYFILSRTATFLDAWANQRNQAGTEAASVLSSGVGADQAVSGLPFLMWMIYTQHQESKPTTTLMFFSP